MTISEAALELAVEVAAYFARAGYPFPARPTLDLDGPFPLVKVWDDERSAFLMIACTEDVMSVRDALAWAEGMAAAEEATSRAETGAMGVALWPGGWFGEFEPVPIRQILGGE
mgnify:CR=1 FL=1